MRRERLWGLSRCLLVSIVVVGLALAMLAAGLTCSTGTSLAPGVDDLAGMGALSPGSDRADDVPPSPGLTTVTSTPSGADFTLVGPVGYTGMTPWYASDVPVGTYTISWGEMAGYWAPPDETRTLVDGGTLSFHGDYVVNESPRVCIQPAALTVAPGDAFNLDILVDPGGHWLSAVRVSITFDPSVMAVIDIAPGDLLPGAWEGPKLIDNAEGTVEYSLSAPAPGPTGTGTFAMVTLVAGNPGSSEICVSTVLVDEDNLDIPVPGGACGTVTISYPRWDINQDGVVDYRDLAWIGASYGCCIGEACYDPAADINGDGCVDFRDLAMLGAHYGEVSACCGVAMSCDDDQHTISAGCGAWTYYVMEVRNTGNVKDTFGLQACPTIGFEGSVLGYLAVKSVILEPGASSLVTLGVSADCFSAPGDYPVWVTATSQGDPSRTCTVTTVTTLV